MSNTGFHATFLNLNDNVPFDRVYRTKERFISAYKRMKNAEFKGGIDFNNISIIKPDDIKGLIQ